MCMMLLIFEIRPLPLPELQTTMLQRVRPRNGNLEIFSAWRRFHSETPFTCTYAYDLTNISGNRKLHNISVEIECGIYTMRTHARTHNNINMKQTNELGAKSPELKQTIRALSCCDSDWAGARYPRRRCHLLRASDSFRRERHSRGTRPEIAEENA